MFKRGDVIRRRKGHQNGFWPFGDQTFVVNDCNGIDVWIYNPFTGIEREVWACRKFKLASKEFNDDEWE